MTHNTVRQTWKNKADFLLAMISYGVGLGNVWRFPYLAYSSGGGAFLIPFIISSIVVGIPFAVMEVALGQLMSTGGIGAWNITPILKGIGFANLIIVFLGNVYYEVILAWTMRYLFASFTFELPWKFCNQKWNSKCCSEALLYGSVNNSISYENSTNKNLNNHINYTYNNNNTNSIEADCKKLIDPITEYWEKNILAISNDISEVGSIKWDLLLTLMISWLIVYFSIFRGMKNSQIVVYITAILPYVFLFIFLIRGLLLPGSLNGILYYIYPDWKKLLNFQVWADAGTQVFYSYGIAISALISLGSYNQFHHNSYRDVTIFTIVNTLTSILSGFVIFSILGYMAYIRKVDISTVAEEGPGLAFIVYPQALTLLPWSPVWSVMFFTMLLLLGLGTQLVATESITTAIIDEYKHIIRQGINVKYLKEFLSGINVLLSFLCGIPMVTNGGMYVFQLFDYYAASRSLLFVGLFEIIAISYVYGVNKFYKNLQKMWRFPLGPFLKIMWIFATPAFTFVLIVFTIMTYQDLTYNRTYKYPKWALTFGWFLAISSLICIPLYAIVKFIKTKGSFKKRLIKLTTPIMVNSDEKDLENELNSTEIKEEPELMNLYQDNNSFITPDVSNKNEQSNAVTSKTKYSKQLSFSDDENSNFSVCVNSQTIIKT